LIVIEGCDNSGKSTLARLISSLLPSWQVQVSEGPPKYEGEMDKRVMRYLSYTNNVIYDRHPCVSQPIYGKMRTHCDPIRKDLIDTFYAMKPLFIYCDARNGLAGHVERTEVDTPVHVAAITENFEKLVSHYRQWAIDHAFIVYRIGDPVTRVLKVVEMLHGDRHGR